MFKLTGKVAIVTDASKGIGAAIAKTLAAHGAAVVVNYASNVLTHSDGALQMACERGFCGIGVYRLNASMH